MSERSQEFIQQAGQALNDQAFGRAAELADQALAADPSSADAYMLKGIALAQSSQPEAATQCFRQAISLDPRNVKAYYNLASHQYQLGQRMDALASAKQALELDPRHQGARDLTALLEQEAGQTAYVPPPVPGGNVYRHPGPSEQRPGYGDARAHSIAFVENMGPMWTTIGWIIVACGILNLGYSIYVTTAMISAVFNNQANPTAAMESFQRGLGPIYWIMSIFGWVVFAATLAWCGLDLADRRGNWVWMVAFVCCGSIGMPIYMLVDRKPRAG